MSKLEIKNVPASVAHRPGKMTKVTLFETARFFCDLYCLRAGQKQALHRHAENDKIYYLMRGELEVTIGNETSALKPGEVVLAPAGVDHGIVNRSASEAICLVFMAPHP